MNCIVTLRAVQAEDTAFIRRVYAGTREQELALTGWDQATCDAFIDMQQRAQATHYRAYWPESEHSVIVWHDGQGLQDVGRLWIDRRSAALHVLDIAVLPPYRGRGIGGACLAGLIDEARRTARPVSIHVEQGNPARRLYERLGFEPQGQPQGLYQAMIWRPPGAAPTPAQEACDEQA